MRGTLSRAKRRLRIVYTVAKRRRAVPAAGRRRTPKKARREKQETERFEAASAIRFTRVAKRRRAAALQKGSAEGIVAGGEEMEEAEVAQNLELLADFGANVAVVGMERGEMGFESVGVGESESLFVK